MAATRKLQISHESVEWGFFYPCHRYSFLQPNEVLNRLSLFLSLSLTLSLSLSLSTTGPTLHAVSVSQLESDGDYAFPICELPHLLLISRAILSTLANPNIGEKKIAMHCDLV